MSLREVQRKTCNDVKNRQSSSLRALQTRQSSITRATSDQGGTTSAASPEELNPIRPRLEAIASRNGSNAARSVLTRDAEASKFAGRLLDCELVQTQSDGAATGAALRSVIRRVERVHRIVSCCCPLSFEKFASLPSAVAA